MSITLDQLRAAVRAAHTADQFALAASTLQSPPWNAIAAKFLVGDTLTLAGVTKVDDTEEGIVVQGIGADAPFTRMSVDARFYLDVDQNAAVELTAGGDGDWQLPTAFTALQGTVAADLRFLAATPPRLRLASHAADGLPAGMTFKSVLDLHATMGGLAELLGLSTLALDGVIDMKKQGSELIKLEFEAPLVTNVNFKIATMTELTFKIGGNLTLDPFVPRYSVSPYIGLSGKILLHAHGQDFPICLSAQVADLGRAWRLEADLAGGIEAAWDEISALANHVGLDGVMPKQLPLADMLTLEGLFVDIDLTRPNKVTYMGLSVRNAKRWNVLSLGGQNQDLALDSVHLLVGVWEPFGSSTERQVRLSLAGELLLGSAGTLELYTQYPDFLFRGELKPGTTLHIDELITRFAGTDAGVPKITVNTLSVEIHESDFSIEVDITDDLQIGGLPVRVEEVRFAIARQKGALSLQATGYFWICGVGIVVSATYASDPAGWAFSGTIDTEISFSEVVADLAARLGISDFPAIPAELDVTLKSLSLSFHTAKKMLLLVAETTTGSTGVVVVSAAGETNVGVLIDIQVGLGVSSLPLVGETIAKIEDIGIDSLQLILTSGEFTAGEIEQLNEILETSGKTIKLPDPPEPEGKLPAGVQLGVIYSIAKSPVLPALTFQLAGGAKKDETTRNNLPLLPSADTERIVSAGLLTVGGATNARTSPPEAWLDIQRSFGPVHIKRIGIGYNSPNAVLMLDAALVLSGMTLDMEGLSLQFPFMGPYKLENISASLRGMSLTYQSGPLEISGGFLNLTPPPTGLKYEYNGELMIRVEGFGLAAIGSFAEFTPEKGGDKSLFLFGVLNATLGGPAFFVVTGIAVGFGYNRSLTIPTLDQLPKFPLVAAAMPTPNNPNPFSGDKATDPAQAMEVMNQWIYPALGQNWLAAGIKFTSFKILESFALLTVSFGTRFEIALLGLSSLTMPPLAPKPIGFAQLALEVTFAPDDGVLKIAAQLTPGSYILSESCHLTGGFALYTWFKAVAKDEVQAGDFVVSLGGYNPYFKQPKGYPTVPRVGANWQVSPELTIKGGFYFALTPVAVMAGGALEANFESGRFKAWFDAKADFLLYWEPFHYLANLSLSLGASYTLGWGALAWTISIHVGVDVTLHGPPFGGTAVVDLYLFSIAIDFGPKDSAPALLSWTEFKNHYLSPDTKSRLGEDTPHGACRRNAARHPLLQPGLRRSDQGSACWIERSLDREPREVRDRHGQQDPVLRGASGSEGRQHPRPLTTCRRRTDLDQLRRHGVRYRERHIDLHPYHLLADGEGRTDYLGETGGSGEAERSPACRYRPIPPRRLAQSKGYRLQKIALHGDGERGPGYGRTDHRIYAETDGEAA